MPYYIKRKAKKKDKPLPLFDKAGITVKKKPDLKAKLDKEFSLFIRLRDCMPNGSFRCISCGQIKPFTQADCGHYFSRTHLATRFDENNCHAECRHCNRFKADHLEGYRVNLIAKIGQQKFDLLKVKAAGTSKMTDLILINRLSEFGKKHEVLTQIISQMSGVTEPFAIEGRGIESI